MCDEANGKSGDNLRGTSMQDGNAAHGSLPGAPGLGILLGLKTPFSGKPFAQRLRSKQSSAFQEDRKSVV